MPTDTKKPTASDLSAAPCSTPLFWERSRDAECWIGPFDSREAVMHDIKLTIKEGQDVEVAYIAEGRETVRGDDWWPEDEDEPEYPYTIESETAEEITL